MFILPAVTMQVLGRWYNCFRGSYSTISAALPSGSWVFDIRESLFI